MLGSLPTETREPDRLRVELADELFAAIESADDTLRYAAPETAEAARSTLAMVARRSVIHWNGDAA